jgi:dsDNA-specific endonuclease/ATPase MutS2
LDSIKDTPQYHAFVSKLEIQIKNFQDPVFQNKIFDRYEETLKDIELRIKQADKGNDKAATLQLLRLKASVLKDQLGASMKAREHTTVKEDMADAIQSLAIDAWETENDKVQ